MKKHIFGINIVDLAEALNCAPGEIAGAVSAEANNEIMLYGSGNDRHLISVAHHGMMVEKVVKVLDAHHADHPLEKAGKTQEELLGAFGAGGSGGYETFFAMFLGDLIKKGTLKKVGHTYTAPRHTVVLSDETAKHAAMVEAMVAEYGMQAPLPAELEKTAAKKGVDGAKLRSILKYLFEAKVLYSVEGVPLHSRIVDECRKKLLAALIDNKDGMTVAAFRDLVQGNRKICLLLFAIFDREGIVERRGDVRVLTEKGRQMGHF